MKTALACLLLSAAPLVAAELKKDVVYGKGGDVELKLDLATPQGDGPFPAVVCIHGGAWLKGARQGHLATIDLLAKNGYVAATIQYRLAPKHVFPAQIADAKCAVRYLRANAGKLKIDPTRIAALGDSAGGHLALLLGALDPADGLEGKGGHDDQPSKVQAVVNYYGPTDLATWAPTPVGNTMLKAGLDGRGGDEILKDVFGSADRKSANLKKASPITYVDSKDAPVLTFQGTDDALVQPQQARVLHDALKKVGVAEHLEILDKAGHGWGGALRDKTNRLTLEFLDKHLKKK